MYISFIKRALPSEEKLQPDFGHVWDSKTPLQMSRMMLFFYYWYAILFDISIRILIRTKLYVLWFAIESTAGLKTALKMMDVNGDHIITVEEFDMVSGPGSLNCVQFWHRYLNGSDQKFSCFSLKLCKSFRQRGFKEYNFPSNHSERD